MSTRASLPRRAQPGNEVSPTSERLLRMPKAELHVHLDGSLRTSTMVDLAAERGVRLPTDDLVALYDYMVVDDARNLEGLPRALPPHARAHAGRRGY
jgi:hypothetical protein